MKHPYLIIAMFCLLAGSASAQNGPRAFDNFDRSQGVPVLIAPVATTVRPKEKKLVKKTGNSRMKVVVEDPLGKKTTTGSAVSVRDGLANRENLAPVNGIRLVMGSGSHLKGFTTGNVQHDSYIVDSSRRYNIDPLLIYSQMHQESSFKITATSNKGASGLMQLMPATARRFGVTKIYDPQQNIEAGVKYMRWLLNTFNGDVVLALAGYNAGEGAVMKYGYSVPPYRETQEYVRRISARYNSISDPHYIQTVRKVSSSTLAKLEHKSRPLTVYEPSPVAVRTADGKRMLVNQ